MMIAASVLMGILVMLSWGISDIFAAKVSRRIGARAIFFYSQLILVSLFLISSPLNGFPSHISLGDMALIALCGILSLIGYLSLIKGLQQGPISVVSILSGSAPVITVIMALLFLDERITLLQGIGVICAIIGAILASLSLKEMRSFSFESWRKGARYGFFSMVGFGLFYVIADGLVERMGGFYPIFFAKSVSFLVFLCLPRAVSAVRGEKISGKWLWLMVGAIGVLEFLGQIFYGRGVDLGQTAIIVPIASAFPIVTITLAYIFFKERLEKTQYLGIFTALVGIVLIAI